MHSTYILFLSKIKKNYFIRPFFHELRKKNLFKWSFAPTVLCIDYDLTLACKYWLFKYQSDMMEYIKCSLIVMLHTLDAVNWRCTGGPSDTELSEPPSLKKNKQCEQSILSINFEVIWRHLEYMAKKYQ